jgi:hypothetical protein
MYCIGECTFIVFVLCVYCVCHVDILNTSIKMVAFTKNIFHEPFMQGYWSCSTNTVYYLF